MKIVQYYDQQVLVFEYPERIELELNTNGCVDIPVSHKQTAIDILAKQGSGYECFSFKDDQYIHMMKRPAGIKLDSPF